MKVGRGPDESPPNGGMNAALRANESRARSGWKGYAGVAAPLDIWCAVVIASLGRSSRVLQQPLKPHEVCRKVVRALRGAIFLSDS